MTQPENQATVFDYSEVIPVRTRPVSTWVVQYTDQYGDTTQEIQIWHPNATLEEVWYAVRNSVRGALSAQFKVGQLGVGTYHLGSATNGSYRDDSRYVNQDHKVTL